MKVLNRLPWILGLFLGYLSQAQPQEGQAFLLTIQDSIPAQVFLQRDSLGMPELYRADIHAPVCETGKCYVIDVNMYWDIIGRFHHLDTLPGSPLTKLDHVPLLPEDYKKLENILKNHESVLAYYNKDELVQDKRISEVDGFTGATANELKASVIEGAVYSCFTLWHIANGAVRDSIRRHSAQLLDIALVRKLLRQQDRSINYFLIDNLDVHGFLGNSEAILQTVFNSEGYLPKYAFSKMPDAMLQDSNVQKQLAQHFDSLDYFAQVTLLGRLKKETLIADWQEVLKRNISETDNTKNRLIQKLLIR